MERCPAPRRFHPYSLPCLLMIEVTVAEALVATPKLSIYVMYASAKIGASKSPVSERQTGRGVYAENCAVMRTEIILYLLSCLPTIETEVRRKGWKICEYLVHEPTCPFPYHTLHILA